MSFANEWLKYLRGEEVIISNLILKGKRPENAPHTEISVRGEEVKQLYTIENESLPDVISIQPVEVREVEIQTSGGFTYYISRNKKMKIKYANCSGVGLDVEKKDNIIKEAKKRGYKVERFIVTDV
jgi:hypothetical protein